MSRTDAEGDTHKREEVVVERKGKRPYRGFWAGTIITLGSDNVRHMTAIVESREGRRQHLFPLGRVRSVRS